MAHLHSGVLLLPIWNAPPPPRCQPLPAPLVVHGYQLYAVEPYIASRDRPPTLVVHTAEDDHAVLLQPFLSADNDAFEAAVQLYRSYGARPKPTKDGTMMITSLARFRSDYTIVLIPTGDYLAVQDALFANINLIRMGCSVRSALTLEEPSETTKDRFISLFRLPESTLAPHPASSEHLPLPSPAHHRRHRTALSTSALPARKDISLGRTKDRPNFVATVLELVKLIQAGLAIFGLFPAESSSVPPDALYDGLLCDKTIRAVKLWFVRIGAPCVNLHRTDHVVDPSLVAALLSLVLATRNRLAYLGYSFVIPRDPFLYPHAFAIGLFSYLQSTASTSASPPPNTASQSSTPLIPPAPPPNNVLSAAAASAAAANTLPIAAILTREIVDSIAAHYDQRIRTEARKVRHVLKGMRPTAPDSDGGGEPPDREYPRIHPLSLTLSLSGGEETQSQSSAPMSSTSSKSQLLSGIASGLRGGSVALANVGVGSTSDTPIGYPGSIYSPTTDLAAFVPLVAGTARLPGRTKRMSRDAEYGGGPGLSEDAVVGASVRALWAGRIGELVRMRDEAAFVQDATGAMRERRALQREWRQHHHHHHKQRGAALFASDGEESTSNARSYDGRSTEEESDALSSVWGMAGPPMATGWHGPAAFGQMWGGRVRGKLGNWAGGLSRKKHHSADMGSASPPPSFRRPKENEKDKDADAPLVKAFSGSTSSQHSTQLEPIRSRPQPSKLQIAGSPRAMIRRVSAASRVQSPTLPSIYPTDQDRELEDDDLLSSGQVSPLSDGRPSPFNVSVSLAGSNAALAAFERERERHARHAKRSNTLPAPVAARVASWAGRTRPPRVLDEDDDYGGRGDPRPVASDDDGESDVSRGATTGKRREKARFHSLLSVVDGAGVRGEEVLESEDEESLAGEDEDEDTMTGYLSDDERAGVRRCMGLDARRRRSFHDLETFRGMEVLSPERMAIDVELCGELLILLRREEHLRNVIECVRRFSESLAQTSQNLRTHHVAHSAALREIETRANVLGELDGAQATADKLAQATHTMRYESEQFRVDDLWAAARPARRTVLEMRARVLGVGGRRRLPPGLHGAHGAFNRLQRTLDGQPRLVDHLGRTEEEAEEERALEQLGAFLDSPVTPLQATAEGGPAPGEDEGEVVAHPGIKPMWLLRFFTSWGARWSAATVSAPAPAADEKEVKSPEMQSPPMPSKEPRSEVIPRPVSH